MSRGGHNAAKVGELLFSGQSHLRGQKRLRHGGHLRCDAPGVYGDEDNASDDCDPKSKDKNHGHF